MADSPLSPSLAPWPSDHSCVCAHPPSRSCQQQLGGQTLVGAGFPACRLLPALLEEEFCFINQEAAAPPGASSTTTPLSPGHDPGGQSPETRTLPPMNEAALQRGKEIQSGTFSRNTL